MFQSTIITAPDNESYNKAFYIQFNLISTERKNLKRAELRIF